MGALLIVLFSLTLLAMAFGLLRSKDLLSAVIISGIFSVVSVILYGILMALDVAITEVAVGSAMSSIFYLLGISYTGKHIGKKSLIAPVNLEIRRNLVIFTAVIIVSLFVLFAVALMDVRIFGSVKDLTFYGVSDLYTLRTAIDFGTPNIVTAILGGYRGFDTLFETTVIVTAAIGVNSILRNDK
jgi:multicomponent Na+:H+ antiporter subunit B